MKKRNLHSFKKVRISILIIGVLCFFSWSTIAQNWGVKVNANTGFLKHHHKSMEHLLGNHPFNATIGAVLQTDGSSQWHHDFNFPEINMGLIYMNLGNSEILGHGIGVGAGMYLPLVRGKGWSFGPRFEVSLASVSKPYNVKKNPKNNVIGSYVNFRGDVGLRVGKQIGQHGLSIDFSLHHFSNGAFKMPNAGLNFMMVGLNYSYYFKPIQIYEEYSVERIGPPKNSFKFFTQLVLSMKELYPTGGNKYGVVSLTNSVQFKATNYAVLESGIDIVYNQALRKEAKVHLSELHNFTVGVYGAYVLPIHRLEVLFGGGLYVLKSKNFKSFGYLRFGGRYQIYKNLWAHLAIKSHYFSADYTEFGIVYKW